MDNTEYKSDKIYYHGYVDYYEKFFAKYNPLAVAEFGVSRGESIKWLLKRFPQATIYGADLLPSHEMWPVDDRFIFMQLDQGKVDQVREFLQLNQYEIIIEDGSHIPEHQVICLIEGMKALKNGGLYILEDIHTSFELHVKSWFGVPQTTSNAFNVLAAIDHYKRINKPIDFTKAVQISENSFFSPTQVLELANTIDRISLYRRNHLPNQCFYCGSQEFDYLNLQCYCGASLFLPNDSMSFVITKKQ